MLDAVLFTVAFLLLGAASYSDIRTREVPDWVNFSGIIAGLGIRAVWSIQRNDWGVLGWGALGFIVFLAMSVVMYYSRQWGGGDSKLLMAMGALLGLEFAKSGAGFGFLIWAVFAGALYGMAWSIVLAVLNWKAFSSRFLAIRRSVSWANIPVLAVFIFGFVLAIATDDNLLRVLMLMIALIVPVLFYTAIGVKAVEKCCMYRTILPSQLTEGDWVAGIVKVKGKYICGPKDLGITKAQIRLLKKLRVKSVLVRDGIPFVPSFLLAFILLLVFGSPLAWFV